jgi:hypothetical protein
VAHLALRAALEVVTDGLGILSQHRSTRSMTPHTGLVGPLGVAGWDSRNGLHGTSLVAHQAGIATLDVVLHRLGFLLLSLHDRWNAQKQSHGHKCGESHKAHSIQPSCLII